MTSIETPGDHPTESTHPQTTKSKIRNIFEKKKKKKKRPNPSTTTTTTTEPHV